MSLVNSMAVPVMRWLAERDGARAEVERMRAENARLRAQIAEYFCEPATHPVEREE